MKRWVALSVLCTVPAWGQTLVVKRVKGNQAVVDVSGGAVSVGQKIPLPAPGTESDDIQLTTGTTGPRNRVIGLSGTVSMIKDDSSTSSKTPTNIQLSGRFGWNKGAFEFGAIGLLGMSDSGSGNVMTYGAGGFFDWNFKPNRIGNDLVMGLGMEADYAVTNNPAPLNGTNDMYLYPSFFTKWFILKTPTALRFDLGYQYDDQSTGSTKVKKTGVLGKAGFSVYF